MRWLITGAAGMLGRDVVERLVRDDQGDDVIALDRTELDITDPGSLTAAFSRLRPHVAVNCAGYTAVDGAETDEAQALRINGDGPRYLARACGQHRTRLIHVSTDYVFSGAARSPYPEDHPPDPRTAYGRTKLAGERAVLARLPGTAAVIRTAWLYGAHGRSFVRAMTELQASRDTVDVVADQCGQPTWTADVAERIVMVGRDARARGIFHATNSGTATWYELAREVFRLTGADPARVRPTTTRAFGGAAPRPAFTALGHDRWQTIGAGPPRDWRRALSGAMACIPWAL